MFALNDSLCFKKLKNSHVTNCITEKVLHKILQIVNICQLFCNTSTFTHHFLSVKQYLTNVYRCVTLCLDGAFHPFHSIYWNGKNGLKWFGIMM